VEKSSQFDYPPVDLYLVFEKSSWKNQVRRTGFSLQKSISKLIFAGYTGSKNPVRNRLKIQFVELDFSKLIFQKSSTDQQGVCEARTVNDVIFLRSLHWVSNFFSLSSLEFDLTVTKFLVMLGVR
jgi:hypothetical protein